MILEDYEAKLIDGTRHGVDDSRDNRVISAQQIHDKLEADGCASDTEPCYNSTKPCNASIGGALNSAWRLDQPT